MQKPTIFVQDSGDRIEETGLRRLFLFILPTSPRNAHEVVSPSPHTLHPTPHTLHPTPYTLHPM
ncbi:MAG: hypothetical protein EWV67_07370 [Microcystis sp. M_QC_C_20170808_M2Col]|nr:MAG: hypothetical protein EWV67_07370 [Microcystis sp. M_QC_C_20170808_M2Col]TRT68115.1 MAG: hypothetical protein EWV68_11615 [Microcystis sp. M_QC_C_20170808_M9Col]